MTFMNPRTHGYLLRSSVLLIVALLLILPFSGCGRGEETNVSARESSREKVFRGVYSTRVMEDGKIKGVLIFREGSFRWVHVDVPKVILYNSVSGEAYELNVSLRTKKRISEEEAKGKLGASPALVVGPYYELSRFWEDGRFRMETADGRRIEVFLEGPEHLPTRWTATRGRETLKEYRWEYREWRGPDLANFTPPEGYTER